MNEREFEERLRVLTVARSWVGTPYHDHQRVRGAGVDCAMLVAAVFEEAGLIEKVEVGYYSPQWFLHRGDERYLSFLLPRAVEIEEGEAKPGDVVVYRIGRCFAHGAIIVEWPSIIHAFKQAGRVVTDSGTNDVLASLKRKFFRYNGWVTDGELVRRRQ